jgi:hypothetical protein
MPSKRIHGLIKAKKTKQTLLPSARPLVNNKFPPLLMHLNPIERRATAEPPKPKEPKRWA